MRCAERRRDHLPVMVACQSHTSAAHVIHGTNPAYRCRSAGGNGAARQEYRQGQTGEIEHKTALLAATAAGAQSVRYTAVSRCGDGDHSPGMDARRKEWAARRGPAHKLRRLRAHPSRPEGEQRTLGSNITSGECAWAIRSKFQGKMLRQRVQTQSSETYADMSSQTQWHSDYGPTHPARISTGPG